MNIGDRRMSVIEDHDGQQILMIEELQAPHLFDNDTYSLIWRAIASYSMSGYFNPLIRECQERARASNHSGMNAGVYNTPQVSSIEEVEE
tara:strand:+ start:43 stop:312 length:270 start_codon:yes stop_codon:yes gene_type:complete